MHKLGGTIILFFSTCLGAAEQAAPVLQWQTDHKNTVEMIRKQQAEKKKTHDFILHFKAEDKKEAATETIWKEKKRICKEKSLIARSEPAPAHEKKIIHLTTEEIAEKFGCYACQESDFPLVPKTNRSDIEKARKMRERHSGYDSW